MLEPLTTKDVGKGIGLGVALVRGIVDRAKGLIVVDSAPAADRRSRYLQRVE